MYKNLVIWKDSVYLIKEIYKLADMLPKSEDYNLKSQLNSLSSYPLILLSSKKQFGGNDSV